MSSPAQLSSRTIDLRKTAATTAVVIGTVALAGDADEEQEARNGTRFYTGATDHQRSRMVVNELYSGVESTSRLCCS